MKLSKQKLGRSLHTLAKVVQIPSPSPPDGAQGSLTTRRPDRDGYNYSFGKLPYNLEKFKCFRSSSTLKLHSLTPKVLEMPMQPLATSPVRKPLMSRAANRLTPVKRRNLTPRRAQTPLPGHGTAATLKYNSLALDAFKPSLLINTGNPLNRLKPLKSRFRLLSPFKELSYTQKSLAVVVLDSTLYD